MKKFYWLALFLGVVIGATYLYLTNSIKKEREVVVVDNPVLEDKGTVVSLKDEGNIEVVKQEIGEVVAWNPNSGKLSISVEGVNKEIILKPKEMTIFIPVAQKKSNQLIPLDSTNNVHWQTAFCDKDTLTVGYDENDKVRMVMGSGYRACGFVTE